MAAKIKSLQLIFYKLQQNNKNYLKKNFYIFEFQLN